jgi:hypothetical protein
VSATCGGREENAVERLDVEGQDLGADVGCGRVERVDPVRATAGRAVDDLASPERCEERQLDAARIADGQDERGAPPSLKAGGWRSHSVIVTRSSVSSTSTRSSGQLPVDQTIFAPTADGSQRCQRVATSWLS